MKYLLSLVLIITTVGAAFGTAQFLERINDNGVDKGMAEYLLERDDATFSKLKQRIPEEMTSTALWRNCIGYWEIKNDSLFLDSVLVSGNQGNGQFVPVKIDDIYSARCTPSGYFADWVTGTLRIVSGEIIKYVHMGWKSNWENEEFVTVESGVIKKRISYKNRGLKRDDDIEVLLRKAIDTLDLGYIPKRMIIQLGYRGFDKNGIPKGYKVEVLRSCGDKDVDNRVAKAIKDLLVKQHILPIFYINGEYESIDWNLPIPKSREPKNGSS